MDKIKIYTTQYQLKSFLLNKQNELVNLSLNSEGEEKKKYDYAQSILSDIIKICTNRNRF